MLKKTLFIIILLLIPVLWFNPKPVNRPQNQVKVIQSQEYDQLAADPKVFVLDVHTPEQKHLPNTNAFIPYDQLEENLDKLPQDKTTPILVYCRSGSMSRLASETLRKLGYQTIYDLEGGANAYRESHTQVSLEPQSHDFDRVPYGDIPTTTFTLTNNTPTPLTITRISTSCSCTQAESDKNVLQPGESASINVSFDPAVHKDDTDLGNLTHTIFVETNNPNFSRLTAEITAYVYQK